MSDSAINTLKTEGYKNWIKGGLGLLTVKDVLCKYTEYILKEQYENILTENKGTDEKYKLLKKAVKCNQLFHQGTWANSKLQANSKELLPEERFNYVEYGKCFIRPAGYGNKTSICDIDFPGLLHILINNKGLHNYLKVPPSKVGDKIGENHVFSQGLNVRNDILHAADEKLEKDVLEGYLHGLIAVLDNLKALPEESGASKEHVEKAENYLSQLQKIDFYISATDELKVLQTAINSDKSEIENLKAKQTLILGKVDRLDQKHHDLQNRHHDLEHYLEQRLSELDRYKEKQDKMTASMRMHMAQHSYIKQKQNLQDYLITSYKTYYVKTSICPLKPQDNNIAISDVYVNPIMMVEGPRKSLRKRIMAVDLVQNSKKETKKIFVIGNVGTGKTSLCKVILHSWCCAVQDSRKSEPYGERNTDDTSQFADIIKAIKEFDLVFFLPLRVMPEGTVDIQEMIKIYLGEFPHVRIIYDIFERESVKCLILVDGLDEWKPPPLDAFRPLHRTYGIPTLNIMTKAKVIVTSGPTSTGILNIHESDYDLKVRLLGVDKALVSSMVERYVDRYNVEPISKHEFMKQIKTFRLEHLEQTPMLLLQILWQFVHEGNIGHNVSDIYSSIIKIVFEWLHTRGKAKSLPSSISKTENLQLPNENLKLPNALEKYNLLATNQPLVFSLSRIAFKIYEQSRVSAPISRHELEKDCDHVTTVLKTGILYEEENYIQSNTTQLSFIHASFFEYFVAVHIVIVYQSKETEILGKLFGTCRTSTDILGLSSIIVMICELAPELIEPISNHIYRIDSRTSSDTDTKDRDPLEIQHLILKCLSVYKGNETAASIQIPLHAIVVDPDFTTTTDLTTTAELMRHIDTIDTGKARNLVINACRVSAIYEDITDGQYFLTIHRFQMPALLQHNCLPVRANFLKSFTICDCVLSHENYSILMSLLTQAVLLEFLQMKNVRCEMKLNDHQDRHAIDLSNNDRIKSLTFENKQSTYVSRLRNDNLQRCIFLSTGLTDIDCLLNAGNLQDLVFGSPDECHINYNGQMNTVVQTLSQLQTLQLRNMICDRIGPVVCRVMLKLKCIKFSYLQMSTQRWREFLESIHTLQNPVKVETHCIYVTENDRDDSLRLVLNSEDNFKVLHVKKNGTQLHLHFELKIVHVSGTRR